MRPATIADYKALYAGGYLQHRRCWFDGPLLWLIDRMPATVTDIGGGRGGLSEWINAKTTGHAVSIDPTQGGPALPHVGPEHASDYITCIDVLEHLAPHEIPRALDNLRQLARRGLLVSIANMRDTALVNGETVNLHLTQEPAHWWESAVIKACGGWAVEVHPLFTHERFWISAAQRIP